MAVERFDWEEHFKLQLQELMKIEILQHPTEYFTSRYKTVGEVTGDLRDTAARTNRLISHIFDLPSEIFVTSTIILDLYLSSFKIKASHINIVSLASFHLACCQASKMCQESRIKLPSKTDIIKFLDRQFKEQDFDIMKKEIYKKICNLPFILTPITFKRIFDNVMAAVAVKFNLTPTYKHIAGSFNTLKAMEIVACDSASMIFFPREVAVSILFIELNRGLGEIKSTGSDEMYNTAKKLRTGIGQLQTICKISNETFLRCYSTVNVALINYTKKRKITLSHKLSPLRSLKQMIQKFALMTTVSESEEIGET